MFAIGMIYLLWIVLEPDRPAPGRESRAQESAAYRLACVRAGTDAEANVRVALWCESRAMPVERRKHLERAVAADPQHAAAHGLLGQVFFHGRWRTPDEVSASVETDEVYTVALARYNTRRAGMADTPDAHWKLSLWCEQQRLKPEATAHLTRVVELAPRRESAWKKLGYRKHGNRWMMPDQITAYDREVAARRRADDYWTPILRKWSRWIGDKDRAGQLSAAIAGVSDPRAVSVVWSVLGRGPAAHQGAAVQVLGQIDSAESTRSLTLLALAGRSPDVRAKAAQTLRSRDSHEIAALLVALLRDPEGDPDPILFHYQIVPVAGDAVTTPGLLYFAGPHTEFVRRYTLDESVGDVAGRALVVPSGSFAGRVRGLRQRQLGDLMNLIDQVRAEAAEHVLATREAARQDGQANARIMQLLGQVVGKDLGGGPESGRKWWAEERGYAYEPPAPRQREDLTVGGLKQTYQDSLHFSCFAAGTPVRTLTGLRAIDSLAVGDQVLTQDTRTGALDYRPIVAALRNGPAQILSIELGSETVRATGIHRFWEPGHGWVMARDLKPGDTIRGVSGLSRVRSVRSGGVEPVYNLRVSQGDTYFVGTSGLLVHDGSEVLPTVQTFDEGLERVATNPGF